MYAPLQSRFTSSLAFALALSLGGCSERDAEPQSTLAEVAHPAPSMVATGADDRATSSASGPARGDRAGGVWSKVITRDGDADLFDRFEAELSAAAAVDAPVVVMFTADWCTPCRTIKDALHDSAAVAAAVGDARFVLIDVDAWRGEAHALIEGTDPSKLPLLVRVDADGARVVETHGTALGLLSEEHMAGNLGRLVAGRSPERPAYFDDREAMLALARREHQRTQARVTERAPFVAEVTEVAARDGGGKRVTLRMTVHNNEAPRRFYTMPSPRAELPESLHVRQWQMMRFGEHVRAGVSRWRLVEGGRDLDLLPVAGWGRAAVDGVTLDVAAHVDTLYVHKLTSAALDGERLHFEKKVPYDLDIADGASLSPRSSPIVRPGALALAAGERYAIPIE